MYSLLIIIIIIIRFILMMDLQCSLFCYVFYVVFLILPFTSFNISQNSVLLPKLSANLSSWNNTVTVDGFLQPHISLCSVCLSTNTSVQRCSNAVTLEIFQQPHFSLLRLLLYHDHFSRGISSC